MCVYAVHNNSVFPDRFNFAISIILLAMVVLGGMGNVWGVMVGRPDPGLVQLHRPATVRRSFNDQFGTDLNLPSYNYLIFGASSC